MIERNQIDSVIGRDVYDNQGDKIGRAGQVYLDDQTGNPEWVTVQTGFFGTNESFVPLRDAEISGDTLTVGYAKDKVKDAPNVDPSGGHLDVDQEQRLYEYYGLQSGDRVEARPGTEDVYDVEGEDARYRAAGTQVTGAAGEAATGEAATGGVVGGAEGRRTAGDSEEMTLAEERLKVGTQAQEAGRARLRKYVVTEQRDVTVPVQREEVRLEREPVGGDAARDVDSGSAFSEEEHEVVLREEVPVVEKDVVASEKVRLAKDTVTDEQTVTEQVRKEEVAADGVDSETRGTGREVGQGGTGRQG